MKIGNTGRLLAFLLSTTLIMPQSFPVLAQTPESAGAASAVSETEIPVSEESAVFDQDEQAQSVSDEAASLSNADNPTAAVSVSEDKTDAEDSPAESTSAHSDAEDISDSTAVSHQITGYAANGVLKTITAGYSTKPSLNEVLSEMPASLSVYLDNSNTAEEIPVTWYCVGEDYEDSEGYLFQFSPSFSDEYDAGNEMDIITNAPYINVCLDAEYAGSGISVTDGTDGNQIVSKYANAAEIVANRDIIFSYLVNDMGLNNAGACGVIANIKYESGYNPNVSGDSGTSYGICQWHNGRKTNLINYCAENNLDYTTLAGQLAYLNYELNTSSYSKILTYLKSVDNSEQGAYDAGWYWCYYFEIPASRSASSVTRGNYAKNTIWPIYKDVTDISTGGAGDSSEDSGNSSGDSSSDTAVSQSSSLEAPTAENITEGILLSWTKVNEADGYRVYRSSSLSGPYTLISEIGTNDITVYTDTTTEGGSSWYYKISACIGDEVLDTYTNTANLNYRTSPTTSASTAGTFTEGSSISVVRGYSVTADGYTWFKLKYNGNYYYCVSKYLELESSGTSYGNVTEVSGPAVSVTRLENTASLTASNVVAGIRLYWNKVDGADSYTIWRRTGNEEFAKLAVTSSSSTLMYTDTSEKAAGTSYEYAVSANCGSISGPASVTTSVVYVPTPSFGAAENVETGFKFSWNAVSGATGYDVYRRVNGSNWKKICAITDSSVLSYTDENVESGSSYTYTVRALIGTTESSWHDGSAALFLGRPSLSVSNVSGGINLSYTKETGANGYIIYRKLQTESSYSQLAVNVGESTVTYKDTTAVSGKTYDYEVKAIYAKDNLYSYTTTASLRYRTGAGSSYASKGTFASGTKIECVGGSEVTADNAVWIKVCYNGAYYYCAKQYLTFNGPVSVTAAGLASDAKSILYLTCPTITSLSNQASGITVKWGAVTGANGYDVYRRVVGGSWSKIARITSGSTVSYTDAAAVSGTSYEYTVRAVNGSTMSSWNSIVKVLCLTCPAITSLSNQASGITVKWGAITGANGYDVYRRVVGGSWSRIARITSGSTVSYTDTAAASGTSYEYTVRAVNGSTMSSWNSIVKIVCLSVPSLTGASKVTGGIKITWGKVTGASGYYLYRKVSGGGWSKIATIQSGSTVTYTDKSGTSGTRYYYTVRAFYGSYLSYYNTTGVNCVKP